jgi:tetratricopeptide (TPR) repeat protein
MSRRTIAAVLLAVFALTGCARDAGPGRAAPKADAGTAVDIALMAFLSEARARHHQANVREDEGDLPGAIAAIEQLVRAKRPHEGERVPEVEEVLADAYARLAELSLRAKDVDAAERAVDEGIAHAPDATYFRGHLLEVKGVTEETRASILADAGKSDEAARARTRAVTLLQQAVEVQEQVIGRALGDAGEGAKK